MSFNLQLERWDGAAWLLEQSPTGVADSFYDFTGLAADTLYRWRAQETDGVTTSDWSAWVEVTTAAAVDARTGSGVLSAKSQIVAAGAKAVGPPAVPTQPQTTEITDASALLGWDHPGGSGVTYDVGWHPLVEATIGVAVGGVDGRITYPNLTLTTQANVWTVEARFIAGPTSETSIHCLWRPGLKRDMRLEIVEGEVCFSVRAGVADRLYSGVYVTPGAEYHASVTCDGDRNFELFVGGSLGDARQLVAPNGSSDENSWGMAGGSWDPADVTLTDLRIWETKRTQTGIDALKGATLDGTETGLVLYFPLDEGDGTQLLDRANDYVGTLEGGATWAGEGGEPGPETVVTGISATEYEATNLDPETTYEWRVRAVDGSAESDWIDWVQFETLAASAGDARTGSGVLSAKSQIVAAGTKTASGAGALTARARITGFGEGHLTDAREGAGALLAAPRVAAAGERGVGGAGHLATGTGVAAAGIKSASGAAALMARARINASGTGSLADVRAGEGRVSAAVTIAAVGEKRTAGSALLSAQSRIAGAGSKSTGLGGSLSTGSGIAAAGRKSAGLGGSLSTGSGVTAAGDKAAGSSGAVSARARIRGIGTASSADVRAGEGRFAAVSRVTGAGRRSARAMGRVSSPARILGFGLGLLTDVRWGTGRVSAAQSVAARGRREAAGAGHFVHSAQFSAAGRPGRVGVGVLSAVARIAGGGGDFWATYNPGRLEVVRHGETAQVVFEEGELAELRVERRPHADIVIIENT